MLPRDSFVRTADEVDAPLRTYSHRTRWSRRPPKRLPRQPTPPAESRSEVSGREAPQRKRFACFFMSASFLD